MRSLEKVKKRDGEDIKVEHKQLQGGKSMVGRCSLGFLGGDQEGHRGGQRQKAKCGDRKGAAP